MSLSSGNSCLGMEMKITHLVSFEPLLADAHFESITFVMFESFLGSSMSALRAVYSVEKKWITLTLNSRLATLPLTPLLLIDALRPED